MARIDEIVTEIKNAVNAYKDAVQKRVAMELESQDPTLEDVVRIISELSPDNVEEVKAIIKRAESQGQDIVKDL